MCADLVCRGLADTAYLASVSVAVTALCASTGHCQALSPPCKAILPGRVSSLAEFLQRRPALFYLRL